MDCASNPPVQVLQIAFGPDDVGRPVRANEQRAIVEIGKEDHMSGLNPSARPFAPIGMSFDLIQNGEPLLARLAKWILDRVANPLSVDRRPNSCGSVIGDAAALYFDRKEPSIPEEE